MGEESMNSARKRTIGLRLCYLPCPQHFHNRSFNEVNLSKTVDEGFLFLAWPCFYQYAPSPFSFPLSLTGGRRVFFFFFSYPLTPSVISHVSRFSCSPSQSDCLSYVQGLPSFSVRSPQRQPNKGLRQRKRGETIKGNGEGSGGGGGG